MKVDKFSLEVYRRFCALPTPKDPDALGMVVSVADQVATEFQKVNPAALQGFIAYCEAERERRRKQRFSR